MIALALCHGLLALLTEASAGASPMALTLDSHLSFNRQPVGVRVVGCRVRRRKSNLTSNFPRDFLWLTVKQITSVK